MRAIYVHAAFSKTVKPQCLDNSDENLVILNIVSFLISISM